MSVKCYFSGVESQQHFEHCLRAGVRHVLVSYWQFHDKDTTIVKKRFKKHPHLRFMVDSGAHTFITDYGKFAHWTRKQYEDYAEGYVRWLVDNRDYYSAAVELDIDECLNRNLAGAPTSSLGVSMVEGWQNSLFKPLQKKGIDIVYVWHDTRGVDNWEEMCAKFDYVGLSGVLSSKPDFNKFIAVARRYTTRIHGFAATKQLDFRDVPWYSIDSITWKTGEMYGTLIVWDARTQRLTFVDDKADRPKYRQHLIDGNFNADDIIADRDYKEVTRFSLWSMRQMEKFYADRYKTRLFYYQMRLPHPQVIIRMDDDVIDGWWDMFRAPEIFKKHVRISSAEKGNCLQAISAIQNANSTWLNANPKCLAFLKDYFPKLADPLVPDLRVFQREMAVYVSPPNPPPLVRTDPDQFIPADTAPKIREAVSYREDELTFRPQDYFFLLD